MVAVAVEKSLKRHCMYGLNVSYCTIMAIFGNAVAESWESVVQPKSTLLPRLSSPRASDLFILFAR